MIELPGDFPSRAFVWRRQPSVYLCTVVSKVAHQLVAGEMPLAEATNLWNTESDDSARALLSLGDRSPPKPRPEVIVIGHAYAPEAKPVRSLMARVAVGKIDKTLEAHLDQSLGSDGSVYQGLPFAKMPLRFELAVGGPRTWNPGGRCTATQDAFGKQALPNWVTPHSDPRAATEPVGFGPIAPRWTPRRHYLGERANEFAHEDWAAQPLGEGFDDRYFQEALLDQQLDLLTPDASVLIENLCVGGGARRMSLSGAKPRVSYQARGSQRELPMRLDTLIIDSDRELVVGVFRASIAIEHANALPTFRIERRTGRSEATMAISSETLPRVELGGAVPEGLPFVNPTLESAGPTREMPAVDADRAGAALAERFGTAPPPAPPEPMPSASWPSPSRPSFGFPAGVQPVIPASQAASHNSIPLSAVPLSPWAGGQASLYASQPVVAAAQALVSPSPVTANPVGSDAPRELAQHVVLSLAWFEPEVAERLRVLADFKELAAAPPDSESDAEQERGDEEAQAVFRVLSKARLGTDHDLLAALPLAMQKDGRFTPRLLPLGGEVSFGFDALQELRAITAAAKQLAEIDLDLGPVVSDTLRFLEASGLVCPAEVARLLSGRIAAAYASKPRVTSEHFLQEQAERVLLEKRAFEQVLVFGSPHLKGAFLAIGSDHPVPVYLPEAARKTLPLFRRVRCRMLCEVRFQEEQFEVHAVALRAQAFAWVVRG